MTDQYFDFFAVLLRGILGEGGLGGTAVFRCQRMVGERFQIQSLKIVAIVAFLVS